MRILSIVINSVTYDSRVLKENASFLRHGFQTQIFGCHLDGLTEEETLQSIPVRRFKSPLFTRYMRYFLPKYLGYLILVWRFIRAYDGQDCIHANDIYVLPVALGIKWFRNRNVRIVYDAHEYETEMEHIGKFEKVLYRIFERFAIGHIDRMITVSEMIAQEYVRLYDIAKPALVMNCPPSIALEHRQLFREAFPIDPGAHIYLFQGQIMPKRYLENLLEVFKKQDPKKRVIVFLGNPLIELEERLALLDTIRKAAESYDSIFYHPAVKPEELMRYTSSADFGFALFDKSSKSVDYTLPNKAFEYCMAGVPFICSRTRSLDHLLQQHPIGILCEPVTSHTILDAMEQIEAQGRDSFRAPLEVARDVFSWENQEKVLISVYQSLEKSITS